MADWVPFFQTLTWVVLISAVLWIGRQKWSAVATAVAERITQGDDVSVNVPGFSATLQSQSAGLTHVSPVPSDQQTAPDTSDLGKLREDLGSDQRGVHLVHVVAPSDQPGQKYEVAAYLSGWGRHRFNQPDDLSDIAQAEFSLGPKFAPSDFTVTNKRNGRLGIITAMYAPALCACRLTFTDGHEVTLSRYLDFESGELATHVLEGLV